MLTVTGTFTSHDNYIWTLESSVDANMFLYCFPEAKSSTVLHVRNANDLMQQISKLSNLKVPSLRFLR